MSDVTSLKFQVRRYHPERDDGLVWEEYEVHGCEDWQELSEHGRSSAVLERELRAAV